MEELSDSDSGSELVSDGGIISNSSRVSLEEEGFVVVLTPVDILNHMNERIDEISNLIGEDATVCRLLLDHFKWDKQLLLERFYGNDKHHLLAEANIAQLTMRQNSQDDIQKSPSINPLPVKSSNRIAADTRLSNQLAVSSVEITNDVVFTDAVQSLSTSSLISKADTHKGEPIRPHTQLHESECGICMIAIASESSGIQNSFYLRCSHLFCKDCWVKYLTHSIMSEGRAQNIACPGFKCRLLVSYSDVILLIQDEAILKKYNYLISNRYVESNKTLRWCPAAGCDRAVKGDSSSRMISCTCGEKFCFRCGDIWHFPVLCGWLKRWRVKCSKDSSTSYWIANNTKECPRCNATIEKDGGCNHMICRSNNCGYEFCWCCMGPWQEHGQNAWYNCNRFNDKTSKDARNQMDASRAQLLRFIHYHDRFMNHQQSLKFEDRIFEKVQSRMDQIREKHGRALNEVKFLKVAVEILVRCRRTLMNTYVFAFYAAPGNQAFIFEDNQRDLELSTEQLSELLERDIYKKAADDIQQKVTDTTRYCKRRCSVLVSHILEGYETGCWEIRDETANSSS